MGSLFRHEIDESTDGKSKSLGIATLMTRLAIISTLCFTTTRSATGQTWQATSLSGNFEIGALHLDATSGYVFAVTNSGPGGGVFRSNDNGSTWVLKNVGLPNLNLYAIAAVNSGHLLVGTYGSGVYRSSNNGDSWTSSSSGLGDGFVWEFAVDQSGVIFAATGGGVYKSTNNGASWSPTSLIGLGIHVIEFAAPNSIFAGSNWDTSGVFRSNDGGANWTLLTSGLGNRKVWSLLSASVDTLYLGTDGLGVFKSMDNGNSWVSTGAPSFRLQSLARNSHGDILAGGYGQAMYRTHLAGESWTFANTGFTDLSVTDIELTPNNKGFLGSTEGTVFRLDPCSDSDSDWVCNVADNCYSIPNIQQSDDNGDGIGNACVALVVTAYCPVDVIIISPGNTDSVGPGFNTFGPGAIYDSSQDFGIGPDGIPGRLDDRVSIAPTEPGQYTVRIIREVGAEPGDIAYFLSVRVPGANIIGDGWVGLGGSIAPFVIGAPVANTVPEAGQEETLFVTGLCAVRRGDINGDDVYDVVDVVGVVNIAFRGSSPPTPNMIADVNSDLIASDIVDVVRLIGHVFRGQPEPGP